MTIMKSKAKSLLVKQRWFFLLVLCSVLGGGFLLCGVCGGKPQAAKAAMPLQKPPLTAALSLSLVDLLQLPSAELEPTDVALLNLVCAQNLPGAGELNISNQLATLDQWAKRVQSETDRHLYRFRAKPAEFENSEGYFRMLMMAVVFYEDFNIRYNPNRMSSPENINPDDRFFADSEDIFLHGLLGTHRMGTCSSMPVLYAAIGRRLGYPLKLVATKAHLFLRWEDGKERFNLEATGRGMNRYDDEHFKRWPFPVSEEEIRAEGYLKSLTAAEELAVFLSLRGNCLKESGRIQEAATCYSQAARLAPGARSYTLLLADLQQPKPAIRNLPPPGARQTAGTDPNPLSILKSK
jgi:hypothetical protein